MKSRTVKTLVALFLTMVFGALALMVMETAPLRPVPDTLAATTPDAGDRGSVVMHTEVPVQPLKWRNIVVHSMAGLDGRGVAERCHFVIERSNRGIVVRATDLWKRQAAGNHVVHIPWRDFNADSIGICLAGDFTYEPPTTAQLDVLVDLVRSVQQACSISRDQVYLHSDLDHRTGLPGRAFPQDVFHNRLLRPSR